MDYVRLWTKTVAKKTELLFGIHTLQHLLDNDAERIMEIWLAAERDDQRTRALIARINYLGLQFNAVPRKTLDKLAQHSQHQGVVVRCRLASQLDEQDLTALVAAQENKLWFFLILDEVQDPHNLGACFRTAAAAGVDAIIAPKNNACGLSATVHKVAAGTTANLPFIQVTNLARTMQWLKEHNIWLIGASHKAQNSIYEQDFTINTALVMGGEGSGLRHLTQQHCDAMVKLPMQTGVASLNVSVAAGICLYEVLRQRLNKL